MPPASLYLKSTGGFDRSQRASLSGWASMLSKSAAPPASTASCTVSVVDGAISLADDMPPVTDSPPLRIAIELTSRAAGPPDGVQLPD